MSLVVRVKQLVPAARWRKRFGHIVDFERMLTDEGTHIVKLFLNISKEEQRARLQDRIDNPDERWKFRRGDLDDRALWDDFMKAYTDALAKTSTDNGAVVRRAGRSQVGAQPRRRADPARRARAHRSAVSPSRRTTSPGWSSRNADRLRRRRGLTFCTVAR